MDDICMTGRTGMQAAAMFIGMWAVMMIPMMLPSLVPALRQLRTASAAAIAGLAYFVVWTAVGLAVYPVDTALSGIAMRAPIVAGMAIVLDAILAQGYGPDGFEQRDGYRLYRYNPLK